MLDEMLDAFDQGLTVISFISSQIIPTVDCPLELDSHRRTQPDQISILFVWDTRTMPAHYIITSSPLHQIQKNDWKMNILAAG